MTIKSLVKTVHEILVFQNRADSADGRENEFVDQD